jgi:hypothetical protein
MHSRPRRLEDIFDVESLRQVYGRLTTDRDGDGD